MPGFAGHSRKKIRAYPKGNWRYPILKRKQKRRGSYVRGLLKRKLLKFLVEIRTETDFFSYQHFAKLGGFCSVPRAELQALENCKPLLSFFESMCLKTASYRTQCIP